MSLEQIEANSSRLGMTDIMDDAHRLLDESGNPDGIDAATVAVAVVAPADLHEATYQATIAGNLRNIYERSRQGLPPSEEQSQAYKDARAVELRVERLTRVSRVRVFAGSAAVALVMGVGALFGTGAIKADATDRPTSSLGFEGDRMFDGNNLTWDDHLLSGDTGTDIPVVGPVIRAVPGIPDFGKNTWTYDIQREVPVETVEEVAVQGSYDTSEVVNPVAPDLQLTGVEYEQARATAEEMLQDIDPATFDATKLEITAYASDEFNGQVGRIDPEQQSLADLRVIEATRAFADEAEDRGIDLDGVELDVKGVERLTSTAEVTQANSYAAELGFSDWRELLTAYDANQQLPSEVAAFLKDTFRRGADMELQGNVTTTETRVVTETVREEKQSGTFNDIAGESIFAMGAALPFVSGMILTARRFGRAAQRRARRQVEKAGIDI